jgi:calcineurin-like phosphoesterase family protein
MRWLMADPHFGHANIAGPHTSNWKNGYRIFSSVEEMDNTIIDNINQLVEDDDELFVVGDFCFGGHKNTPNYRRRINCRNIHIIRGNHDKHIDKYKDFFSSIQDYLEITLVGANGMKHPTVMLHYGMRVWIGSHKGFLHAYGHSHGSLPSLGRSMDVGVDNIYALTGEYRPISEEEFIKFVGNKPIEFADHHNSETNVK